MLLFVGGEGGLRAEGDLQVLWLVGVLASGF